MLKKAIAKTSSDTVIPQCAHCFLPAPKVGIAGQTAVGKRDKLVAFVVCQTCYDEMRNARVDASNVVQHRKKFWDVVQKNVRKKATRWAN